MNSNSRDRKAFCQLRANRFDTFANALAGFQEARSGAGCPPFARRSDQQYTVAFLQQRLTDTIDKAFVSRSQTRKPIQQIIQHRDIVSTRWQEWEAGDHS